MQSKITVDGYDFKASLSGRNEIFLCNKMILKEVSISVKTDIENVSARLTLTIQRGGYTASSVAKDLTFDSSGERDVTFDGLNSELDPYYRWNIGIASSNRNVSFYTCSAPYTYHPGEAILYPNVVKSVMLFEVLPESYWTADGGYPYIGSPAPDIIPPLPYPAPKPVNAWRTSDGGYPYIDRPTPDIIPPLPYPEPKPANAWTLDNNNDGYPWIWGFAKTAKQNIYLKTAEGLVPLTPYYKAGTSPIPLKYVGIK